MRLDDRVSHNGAPFYADTIFNDHIGTNRDVRPNATVGTQFGRMMDQHISHNALSVWAD